MKIITHRERVESVYYIRTFDYVDAHGSGFGFPCDEQGNVAIEELCAPAQENFTKCLNGEYNVVDKGAVACHSSYIRPAEGECSCGRIVVLDDSLYNECECGRAYNSGGQLLAPVSQWESEDVYDTFGPRNRPDDY